MYYESLEKATFLSLLASQVPAARPNQLLGLCALRLRPCLVTLSAASRSSGKESLWRLLAGGGGGGWEGADNGVPAAMRRVLQ